jgi:hypothetical protein
VADAGELGVEGVFELSMGHGGGRQESESPLLTYSNDQ